METKKKRNKIKKLDKVLYVKISNSELSKIKEHAKAKGVNLSAYVRSKVSGKKIKVKVL